MRRFKRSAIGKNLSWPDPLFVLIKILIVRPAQIMPDFIFMESMAFAVPGHLALTGCELPGGFDDFVTACHYRVIVIGHCVLLKLNPLQLSQTAAPNVDPELSVPVKFTGLHVPDMNQLVT